MPFTFTTLDINGLVLIKPHLFPDDRGFFMESYKESEFKKGGITAIFVQDNQSLSNKHVLRGLHYQCAPKAQGKLIRVIKGTVWDVAVDIRRGSPTYKKWTSIELSEENNMMLYIPPGFAHGFVTLSDEAHLLYKCTEEYDQKLDAGIRWDDPDINIAWPVKDPLVSDKDKKLPFFKEIQNP